MSTKLYSINQVPACPGRADRHDECSDPIEPLVHGCSQSESSLPAEDVPEEIPPALRISHICSPLASLKKQDITHHPPTSVAFTRKDLLIQHAINYKCLQVKTR